MITNTETFYIRAKKFQDARKELTDKFERDLKGLERFRGSKGYEEEEKKLREKFETELRSLQDEARASFNAIYSGMIDNIGKRTVKAPTTDQINLLNILKLKKKVTEEELSRVAESVKDNPIAVSLVTEIAHDHGIMRNYDSLCSEMSSETASKVVESLKAWTEDFVQFDTTRASRLAKEYHERNYGATDTPLTKRRLFEGKSDCFSELVGLDDQGLRLFSEVVDGGSDE